MGARFVTMGLLTVALFAGVTACGSEESDGGGADEAAATDFAVGDCALSTDPDSPLDVEKVDCSDESAEYEVSAVGSPGTDLSCTVVVQDGDGVVCFDAIDDGFGPDPAADLDYSTLKPGDCTDASSDDPFITVVLPCDDPEAKTEVLGEAPSPVECDGDVASQKDGVVICLESL